MKTATILVIAALAFANAVAQTNDYSDEVIVKFVPGTVKMTTGTGAEITALKDAVFTPPEIGQILQNNGVSAISTTFSGIKTTDTLYTAEDGARIKLFDISGIYTLKLADKAKRDGLVSELSKQPEVVFAEPNGIATPYVAPNDPHFPLQWGLNQAYDCDIDAPEAWDIFRGSSSIKIGIIDGGVENWHEDLSGKVSGDADWGWDGHGFHVAGIAAAKANNLTGVAGVDWNAQIISQRVDNVSGDAGTYQAIVDAVNAGAHVLNNSWGLTDGSGNPRYSTIVRGALANAYKMNRAAVVAMGNTGNDVPHYPAAFGQGIIAVGATRLDDEGVNEYRASYSSYGNHIDVVAPGSFIISTMPYTNYYGYYDYMSGTSMAAPHVTGLASLLKGYNPNLSNDDIEQIIRLSADDKGPAGWDQEYGTGRINARRALEMLGPNYCVNQWSASGGSNVGSSSLISMAFYSVPGLTDGAYLAYRHEYKEKHNIPLSL
jgi:subtilisin family serine protease